MKARAVSAVCDACSGNRQHVGSQPCVDFGRYERRTGLPGETRYLCEKHSRGFVGHQLLVPVAPEVLAQRKALGAAYARYRGGSATAEDMALIEQAEQV